MSENKQTILVVDDEKNMLTSLKIILEKDFNVLTASNGREGLSIFNSKDISAILLDIDMPVMNGLEFLRRIRNSDKFMKVIMMTGKSCHEWAKKCADLNVQGYVEKPFDVVELIEKIKGMLGVTDCNLLRFLPEKGYEVSVDSLSIPARRAVDFIEQNFHSDICRDKIAAHLNITPDYLSRLFHRECGIELQEYVHLTKIEKSKEYLSNDFDMKIKDVAEAVGISDADYFARFFKQHTGLTPMEFRKKSLS